MERLPPGHDGRERILFETVDEWRAWLADNHTRPHGVWNVSWRSRTGRLRIDYEDLICEALCVGWVDSTAGRVDEERGMLWFSPRRRGSVWSQPNKERVARLEAEGRIGPAGRRVIDRAKADGTWEILDGAEAGLLPDDLAAALDARPGARARWDAFPPSARKLGLSWIATAKRSETRAARVAETASLAARGLRPDQRPPRGG